MGGGREGLSRKKKSIPELLEISGDGNVEQTSGFCASQGECAYSRTLSLPLYLARTSMRDVPVDSQGKSLLAGMHV